MFVDSSYCTHCTLMLNADAVMLVIHIYTPICMGGDQGHRFDPPLLLTLNPK